MKNLTLESYQVACQQLADYFVNRYFGKGAEQWWVAGHIGTVLFVNDRWLDMHDISEFIRNKYSKKQFFEYMNYRDEFYTGEKVFGSPINIHAYKYLKK